MTKEQKISELAVKCVRLREEVRKAAVAYELALARYEAGARAIQHGGATLDLWEATERAWNELETAETAFAQTWNELRHVQKEGLTLLNDPNTKLNDPKTKLP